MLREDCHSIMLAALKAAQPGAAVAKALHGRDFCGGRLVLVAVGKAAWQMANAAASALDGQAFSGVVITKYHHSAGEIPGLDIFEAGHPVPDENGLIAARAAIEAASGLSDRDTVLLLISGGGSALFEKPLIPLVQLADITAQLLAGGANIVEINTIRKRLSAVKGGRFALLCRPARVVTVALSDVIGDAPDMIASGPAYPDSSTCGQALAVAEKYRLRLSAAALALLRRETPKSLDNIETHIIGSAAVLCRAAARRCRELGYEPIILTDSLCCQASEAGSFLASIARFHSGKGQKLAFLAGGETVVKITGSGKGGRNQEIALSAAIGIAGLPDAAVFSLGSDGTDGPTDAAGGFADGDSFSRMAAAGIDARAYLRVNNSYPALDAIDGLLRTGPTGTNVNDLSVVLVRS